MENWDFEMEFPEYLGLLHPSENPENKETCPLGMGSSLKIPSILNQSGIPWEKPRTGKSSSRIRIQGMIGKAGLGSGFRERLEKRLQGSGNDWKSSSSPEGAIKAQPGQDLGTSWSRGWNYQENKGGFEGPG